jgi:hypothetical protein
MSKSVAHPATQPLGGPIPLPPKSHVAWMTWIWLAFAVVVIALTVAGFLYMQTSMFW